MNNRNSIFTKNLKNKNSLDDVDIENCTITNSSIVNCNINQLTTDNIVVLNETVGNIFLNEKMTLYAGDGSRNWSIRNTSSNNILNFKYHNGAGIYFDNLNIHPNHKAEFLYQVHTPTLSTGNLQFTNYRDTWFKYENSKFDFNPYIILSNSPLKSYEGSTLYTALDFLGFNSSSSLTLIDTAIETITGIDPNLNSWDDIERLNIMTLQYNDDHFQVQSSGVFPFNQNKLALRNLNNSKRILYADSGNIGNSVSLQYDFFTNSMTAGSKLKTGTINADNILSDAITIGENDIGIVYSNFKDSLMTNATITYSTISNIKNINILNTNFTSSNITTTDLTATNVKITGLSVGNVVLQNMSAGNIFTTDLTVSNAKITGLSVGDLITSNLSCSNVFTTDITATNLKVNNSSIGNLITSNLSCSNIFTTDLTASNLKATLISGGTLKVTETTTATLHTGTLEVIDQATISTLLSSNTSSGNLNCTSITFGSLNLDETLELSSGQLKANYNSSNKVNITGRTISLDPTWTSGLDSSKLSWDGRLTFLNTSPLPNAAFLGATQFDLFVIAGLAANTLAASTALGVGSDALVKIDNLYNTGSITYIQPSFANIKTSATIPALLVSHPDTRTGNIRFYYGDTNDNLAIQYGFNTGFDIRMIGSSNVVEHAYDFGHYTNDLNTDTWNSTFRIDTSNNGNVWFKNELSGNNIKCNNFSSGNINSITQNISSQGYLELGYGKAGKASNAGQIRYGTFSDGVDFIGGGNTNGNRLTTFYDNVDVVSNLSTSNIFSNNSTITNLVSTNLSTSNFIISSSTIPNLVTTNLSSGTIYSNSIVADTRAYVAGIDVTNDVTASSLFSNNSTITNLVSTNLSTGTVNSNTVVANTRAYLSGIDVTNDVTASSIYANNSTINNLVSTNLSTSNFIISSSTIPNLVSTNLSTGTVYSNTVVANTRAYVAGIDVTNDVTASSLFANNSTINNLVSTNLSTSNFIISSSTIPNLVSTNLSTGTVYSNTVVANTRAYVAGIDVTNDVSASSIFANNSTINNLVSTNLSTSNFIISSSTIPNLVSTNLSTGTLIVPSCTISNLVTTNLSTGTLIVPSCTISNLVTTNLSTSSLIVPSSTIPNLVTTNISTGSINLNEMTVKKITTNFINLQNFTPDNFTMATTANLATFSFFSGDTSASIFNFGSLELLSGSSRYAYIRIHTPCKFKIAFTYNFISDG